MIREIYDLRLRIYDLFWSVFQSFKFKTSPLRLRVSALKNAF
jgi:hypothetical protein